VTIDRVLAVVPARGGSKSIPHKNITPLAGRPLIEYTIGPALESHLVDRVVVSTDDEKIAEVARDAGAEVPFLRPPELAKDDTPTLPVLQHLLSELDREEGYRPAALLLLQPTSPFRTTRHIDESITLFLERRPDSLVSTVEVPHNFNPVSLMKLEDGLLKPYIAREGTRILRRQDKPEVYARNGPVILISAYATLTELNDLYGESTLPYEMSPRDSLDVDGPEDLQLAELLMKMRE
jgi:CMP-N,N'-diacetyllegionaminic acid synthase